MYKGVIQHIKAYFIIDVEKFISRDVHANFMLKFSQDFET